MAFVINDDLWLCSDCTLFAANGDYEDVPEWRVKQIDRGADKLGRLGDVVVGDKEIEFSRKQCDACGTQDVGRRNSAALLGHVPAKDDDRVLRNVKIVGTGYRLMTWDTHRTSGHHSLIGYALYAPKSKTPIFAAEDISVPGHVALDSDKALKSVMSFLTQRPGDTDRDYFSGYTKKQLEFASSSDAMELSMLTDEESVEPFKDI